MWTEAEALDRLLDALAKLDRPEVHTVSRGRIMCGGKLYKIGFSPCELAPSSTPGCTAYTAQKRLAVKRAAREYARAQAPETYAGGSM